MLNRSTSSVPPYSLCSYYCRGIDTVVLSIQSRLKNTENPVCSRTKPTVERDNRRGTKRDQSDKASLKTQDPKEKSAVTAPNSARNYNH